jgi:hypothetical protein
LFEEEGAGEAAREAAAVVVLRMAEVLFANKFSLFFGECRVFTVVREVGNIFFFGLSNYISVILREIVSICSRRSSILETESSCLPSNC